MNCPICQGSRLVSVLERERVPTVQHLLCSSAEEARNVIRGDLSIKCCQDCSFVFNSAFDPSRMAYGQSYDNNQLDSSSFQSHVEDILLRVLSIKNLENFRIFEIGCGNGLFLKRLLSSNLALSGIGVDPSYKGPLSCFEGRLQFVPHIFNSYVQEDVLVICRHLIEHLRYPKENLFKQTQSCFKLLIETPDVEWIFRNSTIWDFFYEHCSMFGINSLEYALRYVGFSNVSISRVFGAQYLWAEADKTCRNRSEAEDSSAFFDSVNSFVPTEQSIKKAWTRRVQDLAKTHNVGIWGVGAKGVTFANLIDPDLELIKCGIEINPRKIGGFIPGTGHSIISYKDLQEHGINAILLMNPNYREETNSRLAKCGINNIQILEV